MKRQVITASGHRIHYLAIWRAHKSQYVGESIYQIEALVNGERKVFMQTAPSVREAREHLEYHLDLTLGKHWNVPNS